MPRTQNYGQARGRTVLHVPLVKDRISIGFFTFFRQEVRAFSDKEIALLANFAAQAVIAMDNARLLTELRESLEQQTAMADVLRVINLNPGDVQPVFDAVLARAHRMAKADSGSLALYERGMFRMPSTFGYPPETEAYLRTGIPTTPHSRTTVPRRARVHPRSGKGRDARKRLRGLA